MRTMNGTLIMTRPWIEMEMSRCSECFNGTAIGRCDRLTIEQAYTSEMKSSNLFLQFYVSILCPLVLGHEKVRTSPLIV